MLKKWFYLIEKIKYKYLEFLGDCDLILKGTLLLSFQRNDKCKKNQETSKIIPINFSMWYSLPKQNV